MRTIREAAERLEELAKQLRGLQVELSLPQQEYTLGQACNKLANSIGKDYMTISPPSLEISRGSVTTSDWKVWDGETTHRSATLAGAVNAAIAANVDAPEDPVAEVEAILDTAVAMPL